jgi:hypothetical protein
MLNTFSNTEFRLSEQNFSKKKWFGLKRFDCIKKQKHIPFETVI